MQWWRFTLKPQKRSLGYLTNVPKMISDVAPGKSGSYLSVYTLQNRIRIDKNDTDF